MLHFRMQDLPLKPIHYADKIPQPLEPSPLYYFTYQYLHDLHLLKSCQ